MFVKHLGLFLFLFLWVGTAHAVFKECRYIVRLGSRVLLHPMQENRGPFADPNQALPFDYSEIFAGIREYQDQSPEAHIAKYPLHWSFLKNMGMDVSNFNNISIRTSDIENYFREREQVLMSEGNFNHRNLLRPASVEVTPKGLTPVPLGEEQQRFQVTQSSVGISLSDRLRWMAQGYVPVEPGSFAHDFVGRFAYMHENPGFMKLLRQEAQKYVNGRYPWARDYIDGSLRKNSNLVSKVFFHATEDLVVVNADGGKKIRNALSLPRQNLDSLGMKELYDLVQKTNASSPEFLKKDIDQTLVFFYSYGTKVGARANDGISGIAGVNQISLDRYFSTDSEYPADKLAEYLSTLQAGRFDIEDPNTREKAMAALARLKMYLVVGNQFRNPEDYVRAVFRGRESPVFRRLSESGLLFDSNDFDRLYTREEMMRSR